MAVVNVSEINSTIILMNQISHIIGVYGMILVAVVGIWANTLVFIVFGQLKPQSGTTLYLQALAVCELITLSYDSVIATALPMLGFKTESYSTLACKIGIWHNMASSTTSSCALLIVSLDRYVYLKFHTFHKIYCSRKVSLGISVGLWIFTYTYCAPLIYFYELSADGQCGISDDPHKQGPGLAFVTFVTYGPFFSIPFVGIIASNMSIIKLLYDRKRRREKFGKYDADTDDVTWLLIVDCVSFLLLTGVVAALWASAWEPQEDPYQKSVRHFMCVLAQFLTCVEDCVDFFLYLLCSNTFRQTLLGVIGFRKSERRPTITNAEERNSKRSNTSNMEIGALLEVKQSQITRNSLTVFDMWTRDSSRQFSVSSV